MKHLTDDLAKFLQQTLASCQAGNFQVPEHWLEIENTLWSNYLLDNQFVAIFDLRKNDFSQTKRVEEVLGYPQEEFCLKKLMEIIPALELFLVIEYGTIAFELMASGGNFEVLSHAYCVNFPIKKKGENHCSWMSRKCMLFQLENNIPATLFEIWEEESFRGGQEYVRWSLYAPSLEESIELSRVFFRRWQEKLGFAFSEQELRTLANGESGLPAEEIATIMGINKTMVNEHFKTMKNKVRRVAQKLSADLSFTLGIPLEIPISNRLNREELIHYAYMFGLFPHNILKKDYKNY